jgi:hypothetical protein
VNEITRSILEPILQTEEAWDKKTRKLRYSHVMEVLGQVHEVRWLDEVYFPRMFRAMRLLHALSTCIPPEAFEEMDFYGMTGPWLADPELEDIVQERLSGHGYYRMTYFERSWWSDEWGLDQPTEQEILELGIRPNLVPGKRGKGGEWQASLL